MSFQWWIFLASLDPTQGSEQAGKRPLLVVSREAVNQLLPVVNVVPLTSRMSINNFTTLHLLLFLSHGKDRRHIQPNPMNSG